MSLLAATLVTFALPSTATAEPTPAPESSADPAVGENDASETSEPSGTGVPTERHDEDRDEPAEEASSSTAAPGDAIAAAATPVYEIDGTWVDRPTTISRGGPVVAEWRVNVNDDEEPPSNEPVDNVTATFTVDKAFFDEIPNMCLTVGVDPVSSLSADGTELTCNFGPVNMGTAIVVQTPVVANGVTGEEIVLEGTSPSGETVPLPPIPIENPFVMDIHYGANTNGVVWQDDFTEVVVDVEWSLRLGNGSDPGPDEVTYRLNVTSNTGANVDIGAHPTTGLVGCSPFDRGNANGHPWSPDTTGADHRNTNFVDSCTLTAVPGQPGFFDLTLSGINYSLLNAPTHDASPSGNLLPPDWDYIASGSLWFLVDTDENGSINLTTNAPTYQAPTGQTFPDPTDNNTTNKSYTLPGGWSAFWRRSATGSSDTFWDDTYRVSAGTTVRQEARNAYITDGAPAGSQYGTCLAFDNEFVEFTGDAQVWGWDAGIDGWRQLDPLAGTTVLEYYVGPTPADPDQFDCGADPANWTTGEPADPSTVKAVRTTYPFSTFAGEDMQWIDIRALTTIDDDVPVGQDVWMFGSALREGTWTRTEAKSEITPTPGARYPNTNGRRDIVRIIGAEPFIQKSSAQATVTPGVPSEFTLTYSANGAGAIPDTVDGYEIVDTLPAGMTYEPGSASPAPVVTTNPAGQQELTWTIDGVATNVEHTLTYQAVADTSVEPGTQLTNTAESSYGGETSRPVAATVTTTTNGFTTILKTSDVEYIPNENGDGVGTGSWTVTIESHDPIPQAFTDTIDILPYNGDQRGTSFSGTYTLDDVVLANGGTVYYTDVDPATLVDDPEDTSNGTPGDVTGNTVGWTTTKPANPTAVRVIGGELLSGGTFSFQVVISTDGAEPRDVYVNRAQARAEHTDLVMRTSAALVVTDYIVEKSSNPEDGSTVKPGDTVEYTVTVTQVGDVPAGALFTDTLTDVFDDADYNGDVTADIGTVTLTGDVLEWEGEIPVGGVATITYSVTVKDAAELDAGDSNTFLNNQVTSPGCVDEESCNTEHPVGYYTVSKTAQPAPGETVGINDVVTYHVQVIQKGEGAVAGAFFDDDLTAALDDATWNDDATASAGEVSYDEPTLSWSGDLVVGDVVDLTYSVTVTGDGDYQLDNVVTSICPDDDPDCLEAICVPAPDQNADCKTTHPIGDYDVMKTSDPVDGSAVEVGDVVEYTVTVTHIGKADVEASIDDDLTDVLDDATWNDDLTATAGHAAFEEPQLTWAGDLVQGDVVTLTYSVTVTAEGDRHLQNVVTTPGDCVPAEGQDEACTTEHINGAYTYSKTSDPEPGSEVTEGDVVTYTVVVEHVGTGPVEDAIVVDDLAEVAEVADWNDDATATSGEVSRDGEELTWTGDLEVGQVVTITYSVTVGDEQEATMRNVVTSPDDRSVCIPAADGNPDCATEHHTPGASPNLPDTGVDLTMPMLLGGMVLLLGGTGALTATRRRGQAVADRTVGIDELF